MAVASQACHARSVVAEFLALGEVAPGVEGLVDSHEAGKIDHGFGDGERGDAVAATAFEANQNPRPDFALEERRIAVAFQPLRAAQFHGIDVEDSVGEMFAGQIGVARHSELALEPAPDFRDGFTVHRVRRGAGLGVVDILPALKGEDSYCPSASSD